MINLEESEIGKIEYLGWNGGLGRGSRQHFTGNEI